MLRILNLQILKNMELEKVVSKLEVIKESLLDAHSANHKFELGYNIHSINILIDEIKISKKNRTHHYIGATLFILMIVSVIVLVMLKSNQV